MTTIEVTNMRVRDLVIKTCEKYLFEPNDEITRNKIKEDVLSEITKVLDNVEFQLDDEKINIKYDNDYGHNEPNESNV
jgi:hypothetical protein